MKNKILLLCTLFLCVILMNAKLKAQVPPPDHVLGCVQTLRSGPIITIKCRNCCEYNAQSGNPLAIMHKCITAQDPYCTGNFVSGRCPKCYYIFYHQATSEYPFFHAIIYAPTINKKWTFDPNAPTTTHSSTELEGIINFTHLNDNADGEEMTAADHELLNGINP
jgi:hypothetical protein